MALVPPDLPRLGTPEALLEWAEDVVRWATDVAAVVNGGIHAGDPTEDPTGVLPGGRRQNFDCTYVTHTFTATNTAASFQHDLDASLNGVSDDRPNVSFEVVGIWFDGVPAGGGEPTSLEYVTGDTVGADAIELRLFSGHTVAVGAPVHIVVRFWKVTPWP